MTLKSRLPDKSHPLPGTPKPPLTLTSGRLQGNTIPPLFCWNWIVLKSMLAVMLGGAVGCTLRWLISLRFNALFPNLPPGTLIVNLAGGFIIGAAMAWFVKNPQIDPLWKLLIVTGLCGGLTTFSTFSAEILMMLQSGKYLWAMGSVLVHVVGSLLMTFAGFTLMTLLG